MGRFVQQIFLKNNMYLLTEILNTEHKSQTLSAIDIRNLKTLTKRFLSSTKLDMTHFNNFSKK